MNISDKCVKEIGQAVDAEVKRQTVKLKQRVASIEQDRQKIQQTANSLKTGLQATQKELDIATKRITDLENELHEEISMVDALKAQLAAKTPKKERKKKPVPATA